MKAVFYILCCGSFIAPSKDRDEFIKDANAYTMAAENRDWSTVVKYPHLSVINLFGGREKTADLLKQLSKRGV